MFLSLVQNEWMKAYYRNKFIVFCLVISGLIGIGAVLTTLFNNYDFGAEEPVESISALEFTVSALEATSIFVLVFSVVILISSIASEFKSGTMKQLLIRPVSRTNILVSKWVMTFLATIMILIGVALVSLIIGSIFFGSDTPFVETISALGLWILYNLPMFFFFQTLGLFIAVLTRSTALSVAAVIVLNFVGGVITMFLLRFEWSKYLITANLSLQDYSQNEHLFFGGTPLMENMTLGFSLTIIAVYSIVLLLIAHLVFSKKDVLS